MKNKLATFGTLGLLLATMVAPMTASADSRDRQDHRQDTKNNWRNLTIGSAVVGLLGLAGHNDTVAALGAAGALYSGYRYDQDRQSQDRIGDYARRRDDQRSRNDRDDHQKRDRQDRGNRQDNRDRR
ncbi:MAG TPA: hypothetical protein VKT78_10200 [Fimbriimonadaceae bacterium]|nr:hypothetical protein [Fimbriimonadaceae bacterium]